MQLYFFIAFVTYLLIILIIGIWASKKNKLLINNQNNRTNNNDFILGGRSSGWLLTALSAHASDMSDWLFMGLPATVYLKGSIEIWIPIGLIFGMFLSWQFIAAKLRTESEKYNSTTISSYLTNKYNDNSGLITITASVISFIFFIVYLSVGIKGIGYVLKSAFDLNYYIGTLLAISIVLIYTLIGGFTAVSAIDLFQGLFLLSMILLVPVYAFIKLGDINLIRKAAQIRSISLSIIQCKYPTDCLYNLISILLNQFSWALGYFGMPHILTKFMGAKDIKNMNKSKYIGIIWQFLALSSSFAVGIISIAYFKSIAIKPEFIFIELTKSLFSPLFSGIILCAILAATISTVDSQLLVLASIIAQDFYKNLINKNATNIQVYNVYKMALIISSISGLLISWNQHSTIMNLVKYAWSGLGSSFGPAILLSLYYKTTNKCGILAAIISGAIISIIWPIINFYIINIEIYSIVPAFLISLISGYLISKITK